MSKLDGSFDGPDLVVDYSEYHKGEESASPEAGQADAALPDAGAQEAPME